MYEPHGLFKTPPDETVIWRYTTWTKFCSMLTARGLFFCRADRFDDPWEGSYPPATLEALTAQFFAEARNDEDRGNAAKHAVSMFRAFDEGRKQLGVNCWHLGDGESDSHWRAYSRMDEGIAVCSSVKRLKAAVSRNEDWHVFIGTVNYRDYLKELILESNTFAPVLSKRMAFARDQELRAVIWSADLIRKERPSKEPLPFLPDPGVVVSVDLESLIEKLIVSPSAPGWFGDMVEATVKRFGLSCVVDRSDLLKPPPYRR